MTIDLTPEMEQRLGEMARNQGTTPESLVLSVVSRLITSSPAKAVVPEGGSLADQLADYIGAVDSREIVPGGARMSERRKEFGALLLERHRGGQP